MVIDWGDVPTWVGGAATLATLGAAAVAAVYAKRVYDVETGRDRAAEQERAEQRAREARSQADLVAAWAELRPNREGTGAMVVNGSLLPVYDVVVEWAVEPSEGGELREGRHWQRLRVLAPPGDFLPLSWNEVRAINEVPDGADARTINRLLAPTDCYRLCVDFTDAGGRRWSRDYWGELHERPRG